MLVSNRLVIQEPQILLGNDLVSRNKSVKYLGLYISDSMKFNDHMTHLKTRLSQLSGICYRLRCKFDLNSARKFYFSCVYSVLTYCILA